MPAKKYLKSEISEYLKNALCTRRRYGIQPSALRLVKVRADDLKDKHDFMDFMEFVVISMKQNGHVQATKMDISNAFGDFDRMIDEGVSATEIIAKK